MPGRTRELQDLGAGGKNSGAGVRGKYWTKSKFFQFFRLPFLSKQTLSLIREGLGYKNVVQLLQFKFPV